MDSKEIFVIKSNGERVLFAPDKLTESLRISGVSDAPAVRSEITLTGTGRRHDDERDPQLMASYPS